MREAVTNRQSGMSLACLSMVKSAWRQVCAPYLFHTLFARSDDDLTLRLAILSRYGHHLHTFNLTSSIPVKTFRELLPFAALLPRLKNLNTSVDFLDTLLPSFFNYSTSDVLFHPFLLIASKFTEVTLVKNIRRNIFDPLSLFPNLTSLHLDTSTTAVPHDPSIRLHKLRRLTLSAKAVHNGSKLLPHLLTTFAHTTLEFLEIHFDVWTESIGSFIGHFHQNLKTLIVEWSATQLNISSFLWNWLYSLPFLVLS